MALNFKESEKKEELSSGEQKSCLKMFVLDAPAGLLPPTYFIQADVFFLTAKAIP